MNECAHARAHMHVYACVPECTCVCMHTRVCMCLLMRAYTHMRVYACVYACVYVRVCMCASMQVCVCMCACVCMCVCAPVCTCECVHACACMHVCMCVCGCVLCAHMCRVRVLPRLFGVEEGTFMKHFLSLRCSGRRAQQRGGSPRAHRARVLRVRPWFPWVEVVGRCLNLLRCSAPSAVLSK